MKLKYLYFWDIVINEQCPHCGSEELEPAPYFNNYGDNFICRKCKYVGRYEELRIQNDSKVKQKYHLDRQFEGFIKSICECFNLSEENALKEIETRVRMKLENKEVMEEC